jgi:hypothetical protein
LKLATSKSASGNLINLVKFKQTPTVLRINEPFVLPVVCGLEYIYDVMDDGDSGRPKNSTDVESKIVGSVKPQDYIIAIDEGIDGQGNVLYTILLTGCSTSNQHIGRL